MTYYEFRDSIRGALLRDANGKTWKELKADLNLPYNQPCPEWIKAMEADSGLIRRDRRGRALVWRIEERPVE